MDFKKTFLTVIAALFVYDLGDAAIMRIIRKYKIRVPTPRKAMDIPWNNKPGDDKRKMRKIGFGEN